MNEPQSNIKEDRLEQRLRRFYQSDPTTPTQESAFWQRLEKQLNDPTTVQGALPATPTITPGGSRQSMKDLVEREKSPAGQAQPVILSLPDKRQRQTRIRTVLVALVATIVVAGGLLVLAAFIASRPFPGVNQPAQVGGPVLTPTSNSNITPFSPAQGSSQPITPPSEGPTKPNSEANCSGLSSLDCAYRRAGLDYLIKRNAVSQWPDRSQTQGDYTVSVRQVWVDNNMVIIGYTVRGPNDAAAKSRVFHPDSIRLTEASGAALSGAPNYADGPEGDTEQGFVVSWQLPNAARGQEIKLILIVTDIRVLGPPPLASGQTPTPATGLYAKGPFTFELTVTGS